MGNRPAQNRYSTTLKRWPSAALEREIIDGLGALEGMVLVEIVEKEGEVFLVVWDNLLAYVGLERMKNFMRATEARYELLKYPKS